MRASRGPRAGRRRGGVGRRARARRGPARAAPNLLDIVPVRLAEWRDADGWIVLERPPPERRGLRGLGDRLTFNLAPRRIRLDEIGSFSWLRFDGRTTVAQVCEALRERYGDAIEPVEERLGEYVRILQREGFLSY